MWETWVQSLGQEDALEKEMATHSSILAWRIPWMEELGGLQSTGSQRVRHDWATSLSLSKPMTVWIINCGKLLERWEYQTSLPVFWETWMQVEKQQLEPWMEQPIGSRLRKEYNKGCLLSPCLFNLYAEHIMRNAGLDELQDRREKHQQPQIHGWYHSNGRKRRTEEPLDEGHGEEWKSWLKTKY